MHSRVSSIGIVLLIFSIVRPDSATAHELGWSAAYAPTGMNARSLTVLEVDEGLVAGGGFSAIGTVECLHIALHDGDEWVSMGSGFNGPVQALVEYRGQVVATGAFTASGGTTLAHAAVWNGLDWEPLGVNLPRGDRGLVVFEDDLYSGGWRWDGESWTEVMVSNLAINAQLVYDDRLIVTGEFHQVNGVETERIAAWDGTVVSGPYNGSLTSPVVDVAVFDGQLVALVVDLDSVLRIWTGADWTVFENPTYGHYFNFSALTTTDGRLFVTYLDGDGLHGVNYSCLYAWDGVEWSEQMAVTGGEYGFLSPCQDGVLVGGLFAEVEDVVTHNLAAYTNGSVVSFDMDSWGADSRVLDFSVGEEGLLIGGAFRTIAGVSARGVIQHDGTNWVNRSGESPSRAGYWVGAVGWAGSTPVAQSFLSSDIVESHFVYWNGTSWITAFFGWYEDPFIGFQSSGDRPYGVSQSAVADITMHFWPQIIAEVDDGQIFGAESWRDRLLVFGSFTSIESVPAVGLALFDGETWSSCCTGLTGTVSAVTVWNSQLVVSGILSIDGGAPKGQLVLWDGEVFSTLDGDFGGWTKALAVYRGVLYVGGDFEMLDGIPFNHIARWNGAGWSPLGEGIDVGAGGGVYDLAVHAGQLWVGGDFNYAGGHPAHNICTWYDPIVPIFLQDMQAERVSDGVRVSWTVSGEGGAFRLDRMGGDGVASEICHTSADHSTFEVVDHEAPAVECRYILHLCAADGTETVLAEASVPASIPSALRLSRPEPNPFNPSTRLTFALSHPGRAVVTVHDVIGRRIATLLDEVRGAGGYAVTWNGCDDDGRAVASGTYVVRLRAGDKFSCVKAVLVR